MASVLVDVDGIVGIVRMNGRGVVFMQMNWCTYTDKFACYSMYMDGIMTSVR